MRLMCPKALLGPARGEFSRRICPFDGRRIGSILRRALLLMGGSRPVWPILGGRVPALPPSLARFGRQGPRGIGGIVCKSSSSLEEGGWLRLASHTGSCGGAVCKSSSSLEDNVGIHIDTGSCGGVRGRGFGVSGASPTSLPSSVL